MPLASLLFAQAGSTPSSDWLLPVFIGVLTSLLVSGVVAMVSLGVNYAVLAWRMARAEKDRDEDRNESREEFKSLRSEIGKVNEGMTELKELVARIDERQEGSGTCKA